RAEHRALVRGVEVGPHPGGAGQVDLHPIVAQCVERPLELGRGLDHGVRVAGSAGLDDRRMTVGRNGRAGSRRHYGAAPTFPPPAATVASTPGSPTFAVGECTTTIRL